MDRIAHPLEVRLAKEFGHGRRLWHEERVAALFVTAAAVAVMLLIVMQESSFAANRTGGVIFRSGPPNLPPRFRRPRMPAFPARVLLMSMGVFSISIKVCFVVAVRAPYLIWYNFSMKTCLLSGGTWICGETIVPEGLTGLQLSLDLLRK